MQHLADECGNVTLWEMTPHHIHNLVMPLPSGSGDTADFLKALLIDTETTGLTSADEVIEIAMLPIMFGRNDGLVYALGEPYIAQGEPSIPISEAATAVSGLTMDDVRGKHIHWEEIYAYMREADIVIAYNAAFDRKMVDRALNITGLPSKQKLWGCAMDFVDWEGVIPGLPAKKLQIVANWSGFWFKAHRAEADICATLQLLVQHGKLKDVYERALLPSWEIFAWDSPFANKDILSGSGRGYTWDGSKKVWWSRKQKWSQAEVNEEMAWLTENIYGGKDARKVAEAKRIDPMLRFGL